eukprot:scaffold52343_cov47-Prasinocladus_malaysianus.AAC.1
MRECECARSQTSLEKVAHLVSVLHCKCTLDMIWEAAGSRWRWLADLAAVATSDYVQQLYNSSTLKRFYRTGYEYAVTAA